MERFGAADNAGRAAAALALCRQFAPEGPGLAVTQRLDEMGADIETCLAALLSEPALVEVLDAPAVAQQFGHVTENLVRHTRWLNALGYAETQRRSNRQKFYQGNQCGDKKCIDRGQRCAKRKQGDGAAKNVH